MHKKPWRPLQPVILLLVLSCFPLSAFKHDEWHPFIDDKGEDWWGLHFQNTIIAQHKFPLRSPYAGSNSVSGNSETATSVTATYFLGFEPIRDLEFYINPEMSGGSGISSSYGVAGALNGETFRISNPEPIVSLARWYVQYTLGLNNEKERTEAEPNQLGGTQSTHRLRFVLGQFSLTDFFDDNEFSHNPRTQFMNWALMANPAWDYAANTRGYVPGFLVEYMNGKTGGRLAVTMLPLEANQLTMDPNIDKAHSINLELETSWEIGGLAGTIRPLFYLNRTHMGKYTDAVTQAALTGVTPEIRETREYGRIKYGFGINLEQKLHREYGIFSRIGWNDGKSETWAFTEVDATLSLGFSTSLFMIGRKSDRLATAGAMNFVSREHRDYLAAGGAGFMLGDGNLNYQPEFLWETYYDFAFTPAIHLALDYQLVVNPGYNSDRGPLHAVALRSQILF